MSDANNVNYEYVAVIAVYMQNAENVPFEENHEYILEEYRKLLNDCIIIMQRNYCRDIILNNNHIYGIYDVSQSKSGRELEATGIRISRLVRAFNCKTEERYTEKLLCGVGIATGIAIRIVIRNPFVQSGMWTGRVFNKAYTMAQMSVCDGMQRVFVDDSAEGNGYYK